MDRKKYMNESEVRQILNVLRKEARTGKPIWIKRYMVLHFLCSTGLRGSEARLLRIGHIRLNGKSSMLFVANGKGGKTRHVPIGQKLVRHLKSYLKHKAKIGEPVGEDDYLFCGKKWANPLTIGGIEQIFKFSAAWAGLPECYSLHSTRHSYGFRVFSQSKNIRMVQELLGHSSLASTMIYSHVDPNQVVETVQNLW